ncbi:MULTISPECIES: arylsulfatase [Edwardsiella]|uniref:Arylsulfatase n=1 Tax=Edwardsiella anguillarum TaxID=1821960 RepID=A0ABY8SBY9_9GAMM|nr:MULTISPECIES: arylsulfatase [Edwardsiella]AKR79465.2 arylsulfatase [Edwardsiella sp. LADL05-105]UOU78541.1 arylsulfatase [Edwardsiella anguillarum]WHP79647.1 arylsulfatase [Edwardsiella anguillarum]WHP83259.1 arylsulfatase [Edwardsiella anguillarum]WHP87052.1 arylsulfatase [Edwardsiella anguillarum]
MKQASSAHKSCQQSLTDQLIQRTRITVVGAFVLAALAATPSALAASHTAPNEKVNVLLIVLDDVGFADLGAFGSEIKTPNIDALASSGVRYNQFDTKAMCSPSRASLLTGRNNHTVNMADLPPKGKPTPSQKVPLGSGPSDSGEIPLNAQNIAQVLKADGYSTYAFGKWHMAPLYKDNTERNKPFYPRQRGFDYFYGFLSGHSDQYHPDLVENNTVLPKVEHPSGYHFSTDIVNHAIDAITKDAKKPKLVYLAFGAAHAPYQVPDTYIQQYKGLYSQGWDELRRQRYERQIKMGIIPTNTKLPPRENGDAAWASLNPTEKRVYSKFMETYAGFLTHTDHEIGRIIDTLKKTGQYDNTMIVFLTDNGAASEGGPHGGFQVAYNDKMPVEEMDKRLDEAGSASTYMLYQRPWAYAGTTPFRRYKLWPYLGGVRTPLIISWPQHIDNPGIIRHQYVNIIDLAPTILQATGTKFSASVDGQKQLPIAGKSILDTLNSDMAKTRDIQYFELRGQRAITWGKWRAVAMHDVNTDFSQDKWELFDTEKDFSESTDLASQNPEILSKMKEIWQQEAEKYSQPTAFQPDPTLYKNNSMQDGIKN